MISSLNHRLAISPLVVAVSLCSCSSDDDGGGGSGATGGAGALPGGGTGATAAGGSGAQSGGGTGGEAGGGGGGGSTAEPCTPDTSGPVQTRETTREWLRIDLPGAVCSNGTQFPIFVNYSDTSNNLIVSLEPGGACWDYASCSPDGGLRGAANPEGIADGIDHMMLRYAHVPLHQRDLETNPVRDWNMVFIPYCTGDIHTGNRGADDPITYTGPNGEELVFRHNGHDNVQKAIEWISQNFDNIPQLLVTGCSAGGIGALLNYHFFREGLGDAVQCSYLLDDSGPLFPSDGNSGPLHDKVRQSWNVDPIIDSLEGQLEGVTAADIKADFSVINTALADRYPQDRLAVTMYRRDLNYSLYSYESFYDFPDYQTIHDMWEEDIALMRAQYDRRDNLGYFLPFWRIDNCSHCVTIPPIGLDGSDISKVFTAQWEGTDIEAEGLNMPDYVEHLIDDTEPLQSYIEEVQPDEGFTPEEAAVCQGL